MDKVSCSRKQHFMLMGISESFWYQEICPLNFLKHLLPPPPEKCLHSPKSAAPEKSASPRPYEICPKENCPCEICPQPGKSAPIPPLPHAIRQLCSCNNSCGIVLFRTNILFLFILFHFILFYLFISFFFFFFFDKWTYLKK